jgi:hypothetical protein
MSGHTIPTFMHCVFFILPSQLFNFYVSQRGLLACPSHLDNSKTSTIHFSSLRGGLPQPVSICMDWAEVCHGIRECMENKELDISSGGQ